jgi:phospholipase D1/2
VGDPEPLVECAWPGTIPVIQAGRNAWRLAGARASGVLIDGAAYYRSFYHAARQARHSILMSGWQFNSGVPLLRGPDVPPGAEVRFLRFLDGLCRQRPALHVYILAWDFHLVFALEREWMQRVIFHWMTSPRFRFRFDDGPVAGGSHHQKFVVIDGRVAFAGGMDVCESRWDDRWHRADNPLRVTRGARVKPYHDVQAYLAGGDAPRVLQALFVERWRRAGGEPPVLGPEPRGRPVAPASAGRARRPRTGAEEVALGPARVALSRTDPRPDGATVCEVARLFCDAIAAARRLVYVETQYFSSRRIAAALAARMRATGQPRLDIVVIVNERAEAAKEEIAVGLRQAQVLADLRRVAARTGHALGLYHVRCRDADERFAETYVHSKLLIVDDRFLTVGSANLTNRSMALDSELHVSWESTGDRRLRRAIRRLRVSLLAEHAGLAGRTVRDLVRADGLVRRLDALARSGAARLRVLGPPTPAQALALELIDPQLLPFDRDTGAAEGRRDEPVEERVARLRAALLERTLRWLRSALAGVAGSALAPPAGREVHAMNKDEMEGKWEKAKGYAKDKAGEVTNDPDLEAEGEVQQAEGEVQDKFGRALRKAGEAIEETGERIKGE